MLYRVENLGPLSEAEVDLSKPLLVLTGPNNTGKTYLAWSLYGLFRSRQKGNSPIFAQLADELLSSAPYELDIERILDRLPEILSAIATSYTPELYHCFAAEREAFKGAGVAMRVVDGGASVRKLVDTRTVPYVSMAMMDSPVIVSLVGKRIRLRFFAPSDDPSGIKMARADEDTRRVLSATTDEERRGILERVQSMIAAIVVHGLFGYCTLFPAERIAVNIFAKELALKRTELVDELVDADIEGKREVSLSLVRRRAGRYPWPIRDSLAVANDLPRLSKETSPFADLATEIEAALLNGRIGTSEHGEMLFTPASAPERQLSVHLTASVVKSLASLVFYFRHVAQEGDFIIIDEPELNLHPDNQRKIARILAKAVNRGFRILISTHSDYVVSELNNLIMLNKLSEADARELGFDPASALAPESVGVYLFNERTARPVPVEETGFSVQTIDDTVKSLNADTQRLYSRLFGES